jgi:hypothetical protein
MSIYLSRLHYQHLINIYRIEKVKIVGNNNNQLRHTSPLVDLFREDIDSTDIETRVDLIEDDHTRIKEGNLEHLNTTLLSSRESHIEITVEELRIESIGWQHLLYHTTKYKWCGSFLARMSSSEGVSIDSAEIL